MPENEGVSEFENRDDYCKEAVCIDAMRIYDSCSDKDCLEDIRVLFPSARQALVDSATNVRIRDVSVITVYIDLQPIPFNKGFYSVDMTFFFDVALDLFGGPTSCPVPVNGVSIFNKKVILYGSEGNVKMFSSDQCKDDAEPQDCKVLPKATVQIADCNLKQQIWLCPIDKCDFSSIIVLVSDTYTIKGRGVAMPVLVKEMIRRRKSMRTMNGKALRSEDRQKLDELDGPGFAAGNSIEYFVTYEVRH